MQYVGEGEFVESSHKAFGARADEGPAIAVLRYLLAVPPSPEDKNHCVRLAYGNGCRPDVWEKFRDRFGVPVISEFFASSEGRSRTKHHRAGSGKALTGLSSQVTAR